MVGDASEIEKGRHYFAFQPQAYKVGSWGAAFPQFDSKNSCTLIQFDKTDMASHPPYCPLSLYILAAFFAAALNLKPSYDHGFNS